MTSEDGTHSGYQNITGELTSHTMQKPQNQKSITYSFHIFYLTYSRTIMVMLKESIIATTCLNKSFSVTNMQQCEGKLHTWPYI
jgi:hypothetical protein